MAARARPEVQELLGFFVNTLVLRVAAAPESTFLELLDAVGESVAGALAHQDVPYDRMVAALRGDRTPTDNVTAPLLGACFMLESIPSPEVEIPGLELRAVLDTADGAAAGTAKFDLTLDGAEAHAARAALRFFNDAILRARSSTPFR